MSLYEPFSAAHLRARREALETVEMFGLLLPRDEPRKTAIEILAAQEARRIVAQKNARGT